MKRKTNVFVLLALLIPAAAIAGPAKETTVCGRISKEINQHLVAASKKEAVYFDVEGGDQIVAYVSHPIDCKDRVELTGTMIEVRGPEKRPRKPTKVDDSYSERQMDVSSWRCLEDIGALLNRLADPKASADQKEAAKKQIVSQGKDALPVLIAHLDDTRAFKREDIQNYYNLPPNHPTPPPVMAVVTVGEACEKMLYELITPPASPGIDFRGKVFSESVLKVKDWKAWWERNKTKSLEQIRKELQPLVDRYWKEHGTEQTVP
jgi:hypothetical protein